MNYLKYKYSMSSFGWFWVTMWPWLLNMLPL